MHRYTCSALSLYTPLGLSRHSRRRPSLAHQQGHVAQWVLWCCCQVVVQSAVPPATRLGSWWGACGWGRACRRVWRASPACCLASVWVPDHASGEWSFNHHRTCMLKIEGERCRSSKACHCTQKLVAWRAHDVALVHDILQNLYKTTAHCTCASWFCAAMCWSNNPSALVAGQTWVVQVRYTVEACESQHYHRQQR